MDEELGTTVELSAGDLIRTRWTFGGRNDAALTDTAAQSADPRFMHEHVVPPRIVHGIP
jgi:hypothetical protein